MWKLTIEDDEGKQTHLPLAHEEYGIGRAETNSIRLTDRNISRNHASLKKNGQGWVLKDVQSYNGTYVNGARVIGEGPVNAGDIVQLGDYRLELTDEVAAAAAGAPVAPAVAAVHQRPNRLVVVIGPQPGMEFPLDKEHFTVGRSEDAGISINHSSVSRVHSELFALGNGRFEIIDKESANGIRINGVELKRGILEAGDALELGDVRLRFVGAGKIFRADMTQTLPAVALDAKGGKPPMRIIAVGAAVGLLAIIGLTVAIARSGPPPVSGATKHIVNKENAKQLEEGLKLLDNKDVEGAHQKVLEIPEDVRPTDDPGFKKIEAAWAEKKLAEVDAAPDAKSKKAILKEILKTDSVDAETRKKVAAMISEIEAKEPPPPPDPAQPRVAQNPGGSSGSSAASTPSSTVVAPLAPAAPAPELNSEAMMRKQLEPKVRSGRASVDEIRMLKAICSHMGDATCRNWAAAELKKKQNN